MQTLIVDVADAPGVLNRVASLIRRRGFNIESLAVGSTERPGVSRMTVVIAANDRGGERIGAELRKLVPVLRVENVTRAGLVARDLAMIKVAVAGDARARLTALIHAHGARLAAVGPEAVVIETSGDAAAIDRLLEALRPYGVREMVRTGRIAMVRE